MSLSTHRRYQVGLPSPMQLRVAAAGVPRPQEVDGQSMSAVIHDFQRADTPGVARSAAGAEASYEIDQYHGEQTLTSARSPVRRRNMCSRANGASSEQMLTSWELPSTGEVRPIGTMADTRKPVGRRARRGYDGCCSRVPQQCCAYRVRGAHRRPTRTSNRTDPLRARRAAIRSRDQSPTPRVLRSWRTYFRGRRGAGEG